MSAPIDRLRTADPAADLGTQPDERGEADLRILLAEPQPAAAPHRRPERRRLAPILVTAVVAIAVIALTAAVLGFVHPRTDVGGSTPPTVVPTLGAAGCHPAEVLPFECGTYESTFGGKAITGDLGGPAEDRLRFSVTAKDGALLLTASTINCFSETVLVRSDGKRLIRIGTPQYTENDCHGHGADKKSWAYAFLNGPLEMNGPEDFGSGDSAVYFQYQGTAGIDEPQLPRNDTTCVPAHVAPFSCRPYLSSGGTGDVAFLGTTLFRLDFQHLNGELTVGLYGRCNSLSAVLEPDGNTVVVLGGGSTAMGCYGGPGAQDEAMTKFFSGVLTYRIDGDRLTFTSGSSSAVFSSDIGACLPSPATSPFCGSSTSTEGSGTVAFLSAPYRLTFGQAGAQLTATVRASCATTVYAVTVEQSTLRLRARAVIESNPCPSSANAHDRALAAFLAAPMTWRWDGDRLALESAKSGPYSSAVFTRDR